MAAQTFMTKIIANVKPEADWLANETYFLLPNETVEAYTLQTVQVNGSDTSMLFLRSKTNTTNGKKLFKELPYNDEYLMYMVQDNIDTAVNEIKTEVAKNTSNIAGLQSDNELLLGKVEEVETGVGKNTSDIATLKSDNTILLEKVEGLEDKVNQGPDTSELEGKVTKNTQDIATIRSDVDILNGNLENKADISDLGNYIPKSGGTATGAIKMPTPAAGTKDTTLATTEFVDNALSNIEIPDTGISVVLSATQPTDQKSGDIWLRQL